MKKTIKATLLVLLAIGCALTFVGCPDMADLGAKVGQWRNIAGVTGPENRMTLQIEADNEDIDWWVLTNMDGVVLQVNEDFTVSGTSYRNKITKGGSTKVTFKKAGKYVLYIHQSKVAHKGKDKDGNDLTPGSKSFRGSFPIDNNQGRKINASDYKQAIDPVGTVVLKNDERGIGQSTTGCTDGHWHGDYTITEIWPLGQNGAEWKAIGDKKYLKLNVKSGEQIEIIIPAGEQVFAIKQPYRFGSEDESTDPESAYMKQQNWYWCIKLVKTGVDINKGIYAAYDAGGTVTVSSSKCSWHLDVTKNELDNKSAFEVYTIKDSDIIRDGALK